MAKHKTNLKGDGKIVVLVVAGVLVAVGGYLILGKRSASRADLIPPAEERTNPDPVSLNSLEVEKVSPGRKIAVKEVRLAQEGYVVVYKDEGKTQQIGKSELLSAGITNNVGVSLTAGVADGDVVWVTLAAKNGGNLVDENKNVIGVTKPVGMIMGHYQNEY